MLKQYLWLAIISLLGVTAFAQSNEVPEGQPTAGELITFKLSPDIDTVAVLILNRMSAVIGGVDQCTFNMETLYDINTSEFGWIKNSDRGTMNFKSPDKLMINVDGDKGHRGFWYDGETYSYYSWDKNQYAFIKMQGNIIDVIDSVSRAYGVEFPGIDVFYPNFTEDAIASCEKISYLGQTEVDGKTCFHIAARTPIMTWQLWVANDEYFLPVKLLIRYTHVEGSPQFEYHYNNWNLNAGLPDAMFNFNKPPKAAEVRIVKPVEIPK